jgi:hypothetical protein
MKNGDGKFILKKSNTFDCLNGCYSIEGLRAYRGRPVDYQHFINYLLTKRGGFMKMAFAFAKRMAAAAAVAVMCWAGAAGAQTWEVGVGADSANVIATLSAGTLTVSGTGAMRDYEGIGPPWGLIRNQINTIIIEDGVTIIGSLAFPDFANLTSVTIANSVTMINLRAFMASSALTSVIIPNSVEFIGLGAFQNSGLTSVIIGDSVKWIANYAFYFCKNLTSVTVLSTVPPHLYGNMVC